MTGLASLWSWWPAEASTMAPQVDAVFAVLLLVLAGFTTLIVGCLAGFGLRYRAGARADRTDPPRRSLLLEAAWIGIPVALGMGIFTWSAWIYVRLHAPPPGALPVYAVGKQWMWKFQHPGGQREIDELHVPAGRPVLVTLVSQDVIHDLFVPAFRVKQDVLPGRYTQLWFTATTPGRYPLFCSQFCGTQHASMVGQVVVLPPTAYASWLAQGDPQPPMAERGARLFTAFGCAGCHAAGATVHAPRFEGRWGKPVFLRQEGEEPRSPGRGESGLAGGRTTRFDEAYVRDCILLPARQRVLGYPPIMPSFAGQIREDQVLDLVAYIRSLSQEETP